MTGVSTSSAGVEQVVLLDDDGNAVGVADKHAVHHAQTPLHLAFSCYVLDPDGRLLVTRRALAKATFPGVLDQHLLRPPGSRRGRSRRPSCAACGRSSGCRCVTSGWCCRGSATGRSWTPGCIENEMCPVFVATSTDDVRADPAEVEEHRWEPWPEFRESVLAGRDVSSWCREQVAELPADLLGAEARPREELPPAAR